MKRLWAFVLITIFLIGVLGVFATEKVSAQSIDLVVDNTVMPSQGTYDYFYSHGIAILDNTIKSITDTKAAIDKTINEPKRDEISATLVKYLQIFQEVRSTYVQTFEQGKLAAKSPAIAQREAVVAAEAKFQAGLQTLTVQEKQEPRVLGIVSTYRTQWANLLVQAQQIEKGNYSAGSLEADSLVNATAAATAGDSASSIIKKNEDKKCTSLLNSSITDCIDAGFTWLIKNTLLQFGGFLVWLTANMLNFAIQISILNFSQWASSSLYPIWLVIRQIVSLFVIFAGLYLGFMYIIGRTETFGKFFGWLIIFALFVNFSYPFSRALVDVSNVISLNVYSAAVGSNALTTDFSAAATTQGANTAGAQIMNRLGLYGLVGSATEVANKQGDQQKFISGINSVPGALVAVAFVFYAAYIFFMATAIIAIRTAVLVFLTVASPLLLVDSVVPKLGDAAMKMRRMFFEQLAVAPVFMIMLALTLKFMEVFQGTPGSPGPLGSATAGALTGGADSIKTFFSILMMLIMLHIMLKVTRSLAGEAGQAATNFMGKVGGFGLGVATGGAGVLARGTIGAGAARLRDSAWMDKMKSSSVGRGMYGLTNSLAQSTYDVRNVGAVSGTMSKAGLTGFGGYGMQKGIKQGFDERKKSRTQEVDSFASTIKDDAIRAAYLNNANRGRLVRVEPEKLKETAKSIEDKKQAQLQEMITSTDQRKRETLISKALMAKDYAMADKLRAGDAYHAVDNNNPQAAQRKADILKKMGVDNAVMAKDFLKKDPFKNLADAHDDLVKQLQENAAKINRKTPEGESAYRDIQAQIGEENASFRQKTDTLRKDTLAAFVGNTATTPTTAASSDSNNKPASGGSDFSHLDNSGKPKMGPGGSDTAKYEDDQYKQPAVFRAANTNFPPQPNLAAETTPNEPAPGFLLSGPALKAYNERRRAAKLTSPVTGPSAKPVSSPVNPEETAVV